VGVRQKEQRAWEDMRRRTAEESKAEEGAILLWQEYSTGLRTDPLVEPYLSSMGGEGAAKKYELAATLAGEAGTKALSSDPKALARAYQTLQFFQATRLPSGLPNALLWRIGPVFGLEPEEVRATLEAHKIKVRKLAPQAAPAAGEPTGMAPESRMPFDRSEMRRRVLQTAPTLLARLDDLTRGGTGGWLG